MLADLHTPVLLSQDELKAAIAYDPLTGVFTRNKPYCNLAVGSRVGSLDSYGYVQVFVKGKLRLAHRLAFLYMLGRLPIAEVDHIDGNRANNAFVNLRECDKTQNMRNRAVSGHSSTGAKGVSWHKASSKYRARLWITLEGSRKRLELGGFDTVDQAKEAYNKAAKLHHGEFYHE